MAFIKELNLLMNTSLNPANTCSTINDLQFFLLSLTYDNCYEHVCMLQLQPNLKHVVVYILIIIILSLFDFKGQFI